MNKLTKSILVLFCICSFIAIILALTNSITEPIIKENENKAANAALLEIMPDGGSFESVDISGYELPATVKEAFRAENGGYVFKLLTAGYSSGFTIMCGVNADLTVSGALCLASSETLGYEKAYGDSFVGKDASGVDGVALISGATKTTGAYRNAVKDAINASIILGGGSVDFRSEEEIFADALSFALPAADGKFTQLFITEKVTAEKIYSADNGEGFVCIVGEKFISVAKDGTVKGYSVDGEELTLSADETATATADTAKLAQSEKNALDLSKYEGVHANITSVEKTASGNYVIEIKAAGYGITGGDNYHPASGEYIIIRVCISGDGKILDCLTVYQAESKGIGDACADEKFYGQFDGKTKNDYNTIDAISGATLTTDGYLKAIERAFAAVEIFEAAAPSTPVDNETPIDDITSKEVGA